MIHPYIGSLGILCNRKLGNPPFSEQHYYRRLNQVSSKYGISIIVFHPQPIHRHVTGYTICQDEWKKSIMPIPDLIYDRCLCTLGSDYRSLIRLLDTTSLQKQPILWSRGLPGKWKVYNHLIKYPNLIPYLPPTSSYSDSESLNKELITHHGQVFLKPHAGSQGKSTLHIQRFPTENKFFINGRNHHNKEFMQTFNSESKALQWVHQFIHHRPYIIQPYLPLTSKNGHPFDIRVLMQKNGKGRWVLTGMVVRQGQFGSATSNLHGGGTAVSVLPYLTREYGTATAEHIMTVLHTLSRDISPILESHFGRLGELGIDYGVDTEGNVWLLEVNSRPGRTSFNLIGDPTISNLANENPLHYARYLLLRQLRRVNS
ncbi:YheC/YheD family protein [Paenibacillus crassostreae]|uniref:YheC/YheD family endospore coat-associated protein n=1 Tax=Paenibacillus crassostreae TaxID=1763538 RepID=UPI000838D9CB|nr:YheC/YheD family protein [Paenibacillus crassostreae]AOZ93854.1 hypothetical protein LPB68_17810 [Paenibacillus crassostreae]